MSNPFKYFKDKKELWADWPEPKHNEFNPIYHFTEEEINYSRRPHFPVSPEPDWEDGKIVYEGKDYRLDKHRIIGIDEGGANYIYGEPIAIPLPKEPEKPTMKELVRQIFGDDAANDYVIVDFYKSVMDEAILEYYLKGQPEQQDIPMDSEAIKALRLCEPFMDELQAENHTEIGAGLQYDHNLGRAYEEMKKVLSSTPTKETKGYINRSAYGGKDYY